MKKLIFLSDIDFTLSPQVRDEVRTDVVVEYAERYKEKAAMPPIVVFQNKGDKKYLLGDGLHRSLANKENNCKGIQAEVMPGGYEEALKYALTANAAHGLRRSNADKRRCVMAAIKQWPKQSNIQLSETAGVSDRYVGEIRKEMESKKVIAPTPERTTRSGRIMATDNIGSTPNGSESKPDKSLQTKAGDKQLTDDTGWPIPKHLHEYWEWDVEVMEMLHTLSDIKGFIKRAQEKKDLMYVGVNFSSLIADLEKAWTSLQCAQPYAVCTTCQGHPDTQPKGQCRLCLGLGLISKFRYDRLVPEETKKVRAKGIKK